MKGVPHGVVTGALATVALLVAGSVVFSFGVALPTGLPQTTQSAGSLSVEIFDMFNVPYRGWWDFRGLYGDFPLTADCFSFENIPGGPGSPNPNPVILPNGAYSCDTGAPGYDGETWVQYPYMNPIKWFHSGTAYLPAQDIQIYAPYRMRMIGTDQPGATLAQPVYLPVFNAAQPPGTTLRLKWDFNYLTFPETQALDLECGSAAAFGYDGFVSRNIFTVTMDLQESKRIFGVVAATPAEAQTWWDTNTDQRCFVKRTLEAKWEAFVAAQGGSSIVMGPYDILNSYEYWYQPFMTNLYDQTIDPVTGETTVVIDHVTWGSEVLFPRLFHWGSTPYLDPGPDGKTGTGDDIVNAEIYPHNRNGWWKWELAWIEDLHFDTVIGPTDQDFTLQTVMDYHLAAFANPGPDGIFHSNGPDLTPGGGDDVASTDDVAEWQWMPILTDYVYGDISVSWSPKHNASELDPYAGPDKIPFNADDLTYSYARPGMVYYGTQFQYDIVPAEWDLGAGDSVVVRLPNGLSPNGGAVTFIDPYSALTSAPDGSNLIMKSSKIGFLQSTPALPAGSSASDSDGDGILDTISLVGPIDWGAPSLPRWGFPSLEFTPAAPPIQVSMAAPWTKLFPGQTMDLTVAASVDGTALPGATVTATLAGAGTLTPASGTTDASGKFKTTVKGNTTGTTITVTASVSKSGYVTGAASYPINIVQATTMTMVASTKTVEMMSFETATFAIRLTDATGAGLLNALITGSSLPAGTFAPAEQLGGGDYRLRWSAPTVTTQTLDSISIRVKEGGYLDATARFSLKVDPNMTGTSPLHTLFILGVPASVTPGGTVTIRAYVYTIEGYVVAGSTVVPSLRFTIQGTLGPVADELNGLYTFTFTAASTLSPGTIVSVKIDVSKAGYAAGTTTVRVLIVAP